MYVVSILIFAVPTNTQTHIGSLPKITNKKEVKHFIF